LLWDFTITNDGYGLPVCGEASRIIGGWIGIFSRVHYRTRHVVDGGVFALSGCGALSCFVLFLNKVTLSVFVVSDMKLLR
jgi:hypothetical protein